MAGILANSAEKTMVSGDTAVDKSVSGYTSQSQITLTTYPTGTVHSWSIARPSGSSSAGAALSSTTAAGPVFTPDCDGTYTVTVDVDGTIYVIRIGVVETVIAENVQAIRLLPLTDAEIPTPASGVTVYFSSDQDALSLKDDAGDVYTVDLTSV